MRKWNKKDLKWQKKKEKEQKRAKAQETVLELSTENMLRDWEFDPRARSFLTGSVIETIKMGIKPNATPQQIEDSQRFFNSLTDFEKSYVTLFVKTKKEETRLKLLFPGLRVFTKSHSATLQPGVTPQTLEDSSLIPFFGPGPNRNTNTQTRTLPAAYRNAPIPFDTLVGLAVPLDQNPQLFPILLGNTISGVLEQEIVHGIQTILIENQPTNPSRFYATEDVYISEDNTPRGSIMSVNNSYYTSDRDVLYYNYTDPRSGGTRSMSVMNYSNLLPDEIPSNISRQRFDIMFGNSINVATYRERRELLIWPTRRVNGVDLVNDIHAQLNDSPMSFQEYQGRNVVRPDYNQGVLALPPTINTNPCDLKRGVIGAYSPFNVMREEVQDTEEECVLCGCELKGVVLKCTQCNNRVHWGGMERYKVMKCPFCRLEFIEDIN